MEWGHSIQLVHHLGALWSDKEENHRGDVEMSLKHKSSNGGFKMKLTKWLLFKGRNYLYLKIAFWPKLSWSLLWTISNSVVTQITYTIPISTMYDLSYSHGVFSQNAGQHSVSHNFLRQILQPASPRSKACCKICRQVFKRMISCKFQQVWCKRCESTPPPKHGKDDGIWWNF